MRILLDANIPYSAKEIFEVNNIAHVRDVGLGSAADADIAKYALSSKSLLIIRDLDFANVILHPFKTHYGVVVLRVPSHFKAKHIVSLLKLFFSKVKEETIVRRLTILEPGRYRIRG
ncbi:MAG TPA: hypothetical protein DEF00_04585 [Candidatus Taylorbacteria bacterium]|nr:MAG: hypothetical protein UY03_C0018G0017 [Parcubacteria group bacterium GW2011_GWA2_47_64]KKU97178.1 MAG: hypothetical protein UY29_C0002G0075 [Parcubacteria group bacterium GW2011_GWC2_48_17]HBV01627.1 hypothetical protein [Candidatus Taylorbacteria bacterium]